MHVGMHIDMPVAHFGLAFSSMVLLEESSTGSWSFSVLMRLFIGGDLGL